MSIIANKTKNKGFTIVELLIVIVIIAILATITIINYSGAIAKANKSSAIATASTFQKKAEIYNADETINRYPVSAADISANPAKPWYLPATGVLYGPTSALNSGNGKNSVAVLKCAAGTPGNQGAINTTNITGLQIYYFDYETNAAVTTPLTVGANTANATTCPAS